MQTYPKIRRFNEHKSPDTPGYEELKTMLENPDDDIVITEKIDGANFRFMVTKDGKLIFGTRTNIIEDEENKSMKSFKRAIEYVRSKMNDFFDSKWGEFWIHNKVFIGEGCWKHTLVYDWDNMPIFLGFDIFDMDTNEFLPFDIIQTYYERLKIPMVKHIETVKAKDIAPHFIDDMIPMSEYRKGGKAEGLMLKNYRLGIFAKHRTQEFKEKHRVSHFNQSKVHTDWDAQQLIDDIMNLVLIPEDEPILKNAILLYHKHQNDTMNLAAKWVTNDRIENRIFHLLS